MLQRLKVRAESFDHWAVKVKEALEAKSEDKLGESLHVPFFIIYLFLKAVITMNHELAS